MSLAKVWAPADSITIRIETDTSWNPSGTLANANSTATITGVSLTTTLADTTVTFAGAFTLTDWVLYHIVLSRITSVDVANYYIIGGYARNMRGFKTNIYNGTVWGIAGGTIMKYISYTWMYWVLAVKTNATNLDNTNFIWIVISNTLIGWITNIYSYWIQKNITNVLTPNVYYYLSNTPWLISTSPWTNKIIVWISESTSSIQLINNPKITSWVTVVWWGSTTWITGIFEWNWNIMYITMNAWDTTNPWNVTLESSYDGITFNTMTSISTSAVQVSRTISVLWLWYYRFNLWWISKSFSITF